MSKILVAGAGKSSTYLIKYLLAVAEKNNWTVIVADGDKKAIEEKTGNHPKAQLEVFDIQNNKEREALVKQSDLVVSLMPPQLHILLAKDCLQHKKSLITSSYISPEINELANDVKNAGLMFMCEMGLDPGIDHMTANKIIHSIQRVAAAITSFKSYCGGLIAPESDNNPWHYKFSWNPANIINAGKDGAQYLENGKIVHIPYELIFANCAKISVEQIGNLAYYPNRDSMRYLDLYDVPDIKTFLRATLRHPDFCKGWQAIIALGLTDVNDSIKDDRTYLQWLQEKLEVTGDKHATIKALADILKIKEEGKIIGMIEWLGLMEEQPITTDKKNSAAIMLHLLLEKWSMKPEEKDMVVMQHEVEYNHKGKNSKLTSTMVLKGENRELSAMAKTVGLPMGILARLFMEHKIVAPVGVHIPNMQSIYRPVLKELEQNGILFTDTIT